MDCSQARNLIENNFLRILNNFVMNRKVWQDTKRRTEPNLRDRVFNFTCICLFFREVSLTFTARESLWRWLSSKS